MRRPWQSPARRAVCAALFLVLAVSCGDDDGATSSGGGEADEGSDERPATARRSAEVTAEGATLGVAGATLEVPSGAIRAPTTVTIERVDDRIPETVDVAPAYRAAIEASFRPLRVYAATPDGLELAKPGVMTLEIGDGELPSGATLADLRAVTIGSDGTVNDVRILEARQGIVRLQIDHLGHVLVAVPVDGITLLGTLSLIVRGASAPIARDDCADWLEPENPKVRELVASPDAFAIDTESGKVRLDLGRPLAGTPVDPGAHSLRVGPILERGRGDCVNMTTAFGSLLLARGRPVRMVAGTATYRRNDETYAGFHQWVETVIDGQAYYVDAFEPADARLIPVDEATETLSLARNRMCGKDADGAAHGPEPYRDPWHASGE